MYLGSIFSLIIYGVLSMFLVLSSLYNALTHGQLFYSAVLLITLIGLIVGHYREYRLIIVDKKDKLKQEPIGYFDMMVVGATLLATLLTFYINNSLQLGGVVASALVGLLGPLLFPKLQRAIFCGSFAGMASSLVFTNDGWVALAGLLSGLLLAFSREIYDGFGGKLGASGFFGTVTASLLAGQFILIGEDPVLNSDINIAFYFIIGAVVTYYINKINRTGTVLASSAVGLIGGLILPVVYGGPGSNYAVALFCGSFVGMTVIDRLTTEFYLFISSFMGSIIYYYSQVNFVGLGGKLGTTAFASVVSWWGLMYLYDMAVDPPQKQGRRKLTKPDLLKDKNFTNMEVNVNN